MTATDMPNSKNVRNIPDEIIEQAHQAEIISLLMESYPHRMADSEISAIASLLSKLTGNVTAWLINEQSNKQI
ncbi:hypothetical protein QQF54_08550 [Lelliottia sp. V106_10]|uniref:hypothetical protein n=1 Tax=Lelliottia wanjuensis TaxID=3050585 RepID=UPI00254DF6B0|nr:MULTISPECIES: hypothetical protein [unclassified Lelliottia]MDK9373403.1 hypothetical protein [Lelliottia sp. V106_10]MDK9600196.1 hypothetical protein [Lelliottia sp. V106_5]